MKRPGCTRRWSWDTWENLEREALSAWLLDRLEAPQYWPEPVLRSAAQLADAAGRDADFVQAAALCARTVDVDRTALISTWSRPRPSLRSRLALHRRRYADAGSVGAHLGSPAPGGRRRGCRHQPRPAEVRPGRFADKASWRLPHKLDVPERFVAYLGLGRDADPTPLAGWDRLSHRPAARRRLRRVRRPARRPTASAPTTWPPGAPRRRPPAGARHDVHQFAPCSG